MANVRWNPTDKIYTIEFSPAEQSSLHELGYESNYDEAGIVEKCFETGITCSILLLNTLKLSGD